jgi:hypothetical protein
LTIGEIGGKVAEEQYKEAIEMATLARMATAVASAHPASEEDREVLVEAVELLSGERYLKVGEVALMLGVSSPGTIRNWLDRGHFGQDILRTDDGTRLFRLEDVIAVKGRMAQTRSENESGDLDIPDY